MNSSVAAFDAAEFRKALGTFATGVTIITTRSPEGRAVGLTVNSFNSVSLNPPLVLWSLATSSMNLAVFQSARHWAVHVLAADQDHLSSRFARRGENKFAGLETESGPDAIPLLRGCTARFQCRTAFQYEGGDHVIFIGEVLEFDRIDAPPLVFHGGRYAHATLRDPVESAQSSTRSSGRLGDDLLGYQLGHCHFQLLARIRLPLQKAGVSDEEFQVLSSLLLKPSMTAADMNAGMVGVAEKGAVDRALGSLRERGLVHDLNANAPGFELTDAGRAAAAHLVSSAKVVEAEVLDRLGPGEAPVLKSLLQRLQAVIDPQHSD